MSDTETITMYEQRIGRGQGKEPIKLYTTSMEEWEEYMTELKETIFVSMIKFTGLGILFGLFLGFFTAANADEKVISKIKASAPAEYETTLLALAEIESTFRPTVLGDAKEFGLFQLHPKFFALKDKSIKGQVNEAVKHIKWLKRYCPADLAVAWNLGCADAKKVKHPKKFGYYIKFAEAKKRYEKEHEDSRPSSPDFSKVANRSHSNEEI